MYYEPLHHKYRPQTFGDLVGQKAIASTLINAIEQQKIAPAYLFTGPRGTGKTSSARILAKSLNCKKSSQPTATPCGKCEVCQAIASGTALDVMEIDAASNTGVDNIREIIERSRFAPVQSRFKVYAIDECHMLSTAAFNALLKTLEEPPPQVVFILATTDPQRVLPTIISRCQRFDYRRIPLEEMINHLDYIAQQEKIAIASEAITLVAQIANGGLRDAESLLDQLSLFPENITVQQVWDLVGAVPEQDLLSLLTAIRSSKTELILENTRKLLDRGREPLVVLQNLASFYLNLLIAKTSPQRNDLVAVTETCWQKLQEEAIYWEIPSILQGQQQLKDGEVQIKNTTQPRLWLEVTLLGLLPNCRLNSEFQQNISLSSPSVTEKPPLKDVSHTARETPQDNLKTANYSQPSDNKIVESTNVPIIEKLETPPNINQDTIWQKAIAFCQPPTTQSFLSQKCHLISLDENIATIGITSLHLKKLFQTKISNIEAAFNKACQRPIKIVLDTETSPSNREFQLQEETSNNEKHIALFPEPIVQIEAEKKNLSSVDKSKFTKSKEASSTRESTIKNYESIPEYNNKSSSNIDQKPSVNQVDNSLDITVNNSDNFNVQNINITSEPYSQKDFDKAVETLTKAFEGQIIDLDDFPSNTINQQEFLDNISSEKLSTSSENIAEQKTNVISIDFRKRKLESSKNIYNRPDTTTYENDDDVPF